MFRNVNILLAHHASAQALDPIWAILLEKLNKLQDPVKVGRVIEVILVYTTVEFGKKIVDRKKVLRCLEAEFTRIFMDATEDVDISDVQNGAEYPKKQAVLLLCSLVETASLEVALVYSRKILDMLFDDVCVHKVFHKPFSW